ncbi:Transcription factor tau subunit [Meyerozyma sp. JA9]|nr:Transcription factor tau subunit [Meyerozyma sp. JA9]
MASSNVFENPEGDDIAHEIPNIDLHLSSDDDNDGDMDDQVVLFSSSDEYMSGEEIEDDLDDDYDFRDALRSAGNFRTKKKSSSSKSYWKRKMMRSDNRELDPEVRILLSQANEAFVRNDYQVALNLYLEVIKKDAKNFSAYKALGEIFKRQGKLNECCNYWLLAANIHPWNSPFWASVAELSNELGHIDQAIYCYGRAIQSDNTKNPKYIMERALLYKEKGQFGRALEGFQKVHRTFPTDSGIIKNLASVYVEQKRLNDAINLYMRILDQNMKAAPKQKLSVPRFGWPELNILCELYIQQHSWRIGIKVIKLVARWIQDRTAETWWDEVDDDSEFDSRRFTVLDSLSEPQRSIARQKLYDIPVDIRFKIGYLRLGLEQKEEALRHFEFLLDEQDDIADLFFEAGKILEAHGYHEDALVYLSRSSMADENGPKVVSLLGKCYLEIGDYSSAMQAYRSLLSADPDNVDAKLALAEALYHLGEVDESLQLLRDVSTGRDSAVLQKAPEDSHTEPMEVDVEENLSLIKSKQLMRTSRSAKLSDEEKMELEDSAKRKVLEKYRRMQRLEAANDKVAIAAWIQLASQLVEMFVNVRSFFPRDKNRAFKGIVLYRRKKQMGLDEKLARVYNLYDGIVSDESYARSFLTSTTEYRGLSYDDWFKIFVQYAILLAKYDKNYEDATQVIDVAMEVSVFIQDKTKETTLKMVSMIFGVLRGDSSNSVMTNVRYFLTANQFSHYIYKFFMCCFSSGVEAWETFTNYNHQKFFLRQLKTYDSIISKKKITGMATISADLTGTNFSREHLELLYVYANLLGGSRSYVSSIVYLNRAYKEYNQDPMVCFVLGLAHVHRAMQRLSTNRHIQILQGLSYILEYQQLKEKSSTVYDAQEINYNFGRLFHMLGLLSEAVEFYEKVLQMHEQIDDKNYDLSVEAAYNLSLIYNINGNSKLASDLTDRYLTI